MSALPNPLERLKAMGFCRCGEWALDGMSIKLKLDLYESATNVLYAYVVDGSVNYIGKTVQTLKKRMYGYQNPGSTQSTNLQGNHLILSALEKETAVQIYVLPDNGLLYYGGFHVNLAAGLEDALISELAPIWNRSGSTRDKQSASE